MLKKIVATCITAVIMCTTLFTAIPVSAATGTDISETFEYYGSMDGVDPSELLRAFWKTGGCLTNNKHSIDETKSAPSRGNGKGKGNYRSMKMDIKFGPADDSWGSCRINTHEDWGCVKDSIAQYDESLAFSFWADAEKEMVIKASIDINNEPYGKQITIKPGWHQYTLKFTELSPQTEKYGKGTKIFEVQKMSDAGTGGWKYAFFCGFKMEINSSWQDAQENTLWLDTFAIHGDTIKERTEYKVEVGSTIYETELDCDGVVPKNFVAETNTSSNKDDGSTSSDKNNTTSSNKNNNTSSGKNTTNNKNTTSSNIKDTDNSKIDNDVSTDSSEISNGNEDGQSVNTNANDKDQDSKLNLGLVLSLIFGASLIIGNGVAVILFVVQKKKCKK